MLLRAASDELLRVGDEATDDKDRVLRRGSGEATYFGVDVAHHHYVKFAAADRLIRAVG